MRAQATSAARQNAVVIRCFLEIAFSTAIAMETSTLIRSLSVSHRPPSSACDADRDAPGSIKGISKLMMPSEARAASGRSGRSAAPPRTASALSRAAGRCWASRPREKFCNASSELVVAFTSGFVSAGNHRARFAGVGAGSARDSSTALRTYAFRARRTVSGLQRCAGRRIDHRGRRGRGEAVPPADVIAGARYRRKPSRIGDFTRHGFIRARGGLDVPCGEGFGGCAMTAPR